MFVVWGEGSGGGGGGVVGTLGPVKGLALVKSPAGKVVELFSQVL